MPTTTTAVQTTNRIAASIERMRIQVQDRIDSGRITAQQADETSKALDMDMEEYCKFQAMKSLASMDGGLTLAEAQTVYMHLGDSLETFNFRPVHVKAVLTSLFAELLRRHIGGAS